MYDEIKWFELYLNYFLRITFILGDELKQTVSIVVDLASVFDPDGVDVYFLNREPVFHVRNSQQLMPVFAIPPSGIFKNEANIFDFLIFI